MKISVNILTWNTFPEVHETLHVLANELKGIESEVIIVDNGSTDGCQDLATIKNECNMGISYAKNQGVRASQGEYILLLDGDIIPVPNSIRCLLNYMEEHREIHALGFHGNKFSNVKNRHGQKLYEEYCEKLVDIQEHMAHCIYYGMYRRLEVFGPGKVQFDENYGVGYGWEDLDSYMQMVHLGIKQFVAHINHPGGKYYHNINSSIRQMGFQKYMSSSMARSKIYSKKWDKSNVARQSIA